MDIKRKRGRGWACVGPKGVRVGVGFCMIQIGLILGVINTLVRLVCI